MMARDGDGDGDDYAVYRAHTGAKSSVLRRFLGTRCADTLLDWVIFPLLLFVQFGQTMYCQQRFGVVQLRWMPTMGLITFFCFISAKHRSVFRAHPIQSVTLLLLPEVFTNIVLGTLLFVTDVVTAYNTLAVLTGVLLVAAVVGDIQVREFERLVRLSEIDDNYQLLHSEEIESSDDEFVC